MKRRSRKYFARKKYRKVVADVVKRSPFPNFKCETATAVEFENRPLGKALTELLNDLQSDLTVIEAKRIITYGNA